MPEPYYSDDSVTLYHGDALAVVHELPSGSVDCIVTSPPYYGLRDYGIAGQYGLEESPDAYVQTMRALFGELRRVLVEDGTCWINLGDSFSGKHGCRVKDLPQKNLIGIPWRVALALQADGWILRSDIVWAKRNCLPEAVLDRPSRAHEYLFLIVKRPRYWYDADAIRSEADPAEHRRLVRYAKESATHSARAATTGQPDNINNVGLHARVGSDRPNARDVWTITAQPFTGAHFAVMPSEMAERCIAAGCKPGGVVLDPFSGSGTTGLAAAKHGRSYVGIDLNAEYLDLSLRTRLLQPGLFEQGA